MNALLMKTIPLFRGSKVKSRRARCPAFRRLEIEPLESRALPSGLTPLAPQFAAYAASTMLPGAAPVAPQFTAYPVSANAIDISWSLVSGASGYNVFQWINGAGAVKVGSYGSGETVAHIPGLSLNTTYSFVMNAFNSDGTTWSSWQNVSMSRPAVPQFMAYPVSANAIDISWNLASGASGYNVFQWNGTTAVQIGPTYTSGTTVAHIAGLTQATTYSFVVTASNVLGTTWASWQDVKTSAPAVPQVTVYPASTTAMDIFWNKVSGAAGYTVYQWIGGAPVQVGNFGAQTTYQRIPNLSLNNTYSFTVCASNGLGTAWASWQNVTMSRPAVPQFTVYGVSGTEIYISWSKTSGAAGYSVYNGAGNQIGNFGAAAGTTFQRITGLTPGSVYYFNIVAYNALGTTWANWQGAGTYAAPFPPRFTAYAHATNEIDISWTGVSGASGYKVYEWMGNKAVLKQTLGSGSTLAHITGLSQWTAHAFNVTAYNPGGESWGGWQTATTWISVDHPASAAPYFRVNGGLFRADYKPYYDDVIQGYLGDCWLLASLSAVAARNQSAISSMIYYKGTAYEAGGWGWVSIYGVRFYNSAGVAHEVLVDNFLPDGGGYYADTPNGVLWVALVEKAYAQANKYGWVTTDYPGIGSYAALDGGYPHWALHAITGKSATRSPLTSTNPIVSKWNLGEYVVLSTGSSVEDSRMVTNHAYAMVGYNAYDPDDMPFHIYNPWGRAASAAAGKLGGFWANEEFVLCEFAYNSFGVRAAIKSTIFTALMPAFTTDHVPANYYDTDGHFTVDVTPLQIKYAMELTYTQTAFGGLGKKQFA